MDKNQDNRPDYIYVLKDPRTNKIRYVGETLNPTKRQREHKTTKGHRGHNFNWINSLEKQNLYPILEIVEKCPNKTEGLIREKYWQDKLKLEGCNLTNNIPCGLPNPTYGIPLKEETKQKISKTLMGHSSTIGFTGRKHSRETKLKMSEKRIGKPRPVEVKIKISKTKTGDPRCITRGNLGHHMPDSAKKKISEANKNKIITKESRLKMSLSQTGRKHSEETKLKMSIKAKERYSKINLLE